MKTIQELLVDRPEALEKIQDLIKYHDAWIVGGAARVLLYPFLPFPQDIDVLINMDRPANAITANTAVAMAPCTGSGGQGQKETVGGVVLDVFENGLTKWLHGVPCNGDGLAIRAQDNFVLMTEGFARKSWTEVSKDYAGVTRPDYLVKHQASLARDQFHISAMFQRDLADEAAM